MKLDIQMFADGKVVIETDLNTKNFQNGLDRMQSATQKAGSTIKNIVTALGITKIISVAMNEIRNSIDGAVARVDTLNNFPKVMSNLGIASKDAEKSISKMSDKLAGLPTTLDQGAMAVQRFTSANGDIKKSTNLFLALNNAILAGGASSEIQASALEQLSQAYAKGKPDMMEWRTAMTAMPAQLKQVAKAMGYVNADELGEALREGTISMDEFMDTIIKLNEEGIDGFQSFEKQARNSTDGIKTAITVARTQVVKGVADIIGALNKKLEKTEFGSLAGMIQEVGVRSKIAIDNVASLINGELSITDFSKGIVGIFNRAIETTNQNFPRFFDAGLKLISQLADGLLSEKAITKTINNTINLVSTILGTITDRTDEIVNKGMDIVVNLANGISDGYPKLTEKLSELSNKIVSQLADEKFQNQVAEKGGQIIGSLVVGFIRGIPKMLETIRNIKGFIQYELQKLPETMVKLGIEAIKGFIDGFLNQGKKALKDIGNWANSVVDTVKKTLKIKSPSRVFRDEVGAMMAEGINVGFAEEISDVYRDIERAINFEQSRLLANVETGNVFNTLQNSTPVSIKVIGDVDLDGQKVGRLLTPEVSRTIKTGGGV